MCHESRFWIDLDRWGLAFNEISAKGFRVGCT